MPNFYICPGSWITGLQNLPAGFLTLAYHNFTTRTDIKNFWRDQKKTFPVKYTFAYLALMVFFLYMKYLKKLSRYPKIKCTPPPLNKRLEITNPPIYRTYFCFPWMFDIVGGWLFSHTPPSIIVMFTQGYSRLQSSQLRMLWLYKYITKCILLEYQLIFLLVFLYLARQKAGKKTLNNTCLDMVNR